MVVQNRITFGGLASGLDTTAIIEALMDLQRRPISVQETRRDAETIKRNALQQEPAGTGSIASISGTPTAAKKAGVYTISSTAAGQLNVTFKPADGSGSVTQVGSIVPGGTNTSLIPGVTLTAAGVLVDGTDAITIAATERGLGLTLNDYVESLTRAGGTFSVRDDEFQSRIDSIADQIERLEQRAEAREAQLVRQFTALELTIGRLQSQQEALGSMVAQLNANRPQQRN